MNPRHALDLPVQACAAREDGQCASEHEATPEVGVGSTGLGGLTHPTQTGGLPTIMVPASYDRTTTPRRTDTTPLAEYRARNLLAQSILGWSDDLTDLEKRVLAVLRGEVCL